MTISYSIRCVCLPRVLKSDTVFCRWWHIGQSRGPLKGRVRFTEIDVVIGSIRVGR